MKYVDPCSFEAITLKDDEVVVYLIGERGNEHAVKIGIASSMRTRLRDMQTGNPRRLRVLDTFIGSREDELSLHTELRDKRIFGEWFKKCPEVLSAFDLTKKKREEVACGLQFADKES